MGKILSERLADPDDPIYREPAHSYPPHWSRRWITVKLGRHGRTAPFRSSGQPGSHLRQRRRQPQHRRRVFIGRRGQVTVNVPVAFSDA
jgi:hypothetical protein